MKNIISTIGWNKGKPIPSMEPKMQQLLQVFLASNMEYLDCKGYLVEGDPRSRFSVRMVRKPSITPREVVTIVVNHSSSAEVILG